MGSWLAKRVRVIYCDHYHVHELENRYRSRWIDTSLGTSMNLKKERGSIITLW